jgi:hypothetical protein
LRRVDLILAVSVVGAVASQPSQAKSQAKPACVYQNARLFHEASDHSPLIGAIPASTP